MALAVSLAERALRLVSTVEGSEEEGDFGAIDSKVRLAVIAALERGETHYTDRPGILPLRQQVASSLERTYGVHYDPKTSVTITCGATEARFVAIQQLLADGDVLLCLSGRERVAAAVSLRGATCREVDASSYDEVLVDDRVKVLYLTPEDVTPDVSDTWLERAGREGWWLIVETDEVGGGVHPGTEPRLTDRTVSVGGVGEDHGLKSWRVGYLASPNMRAGELRSFKQALTICTTNLSQWAALALMEE
ncbi:MAG: aminotransferase class I/II-fold pyridoxal phosphate-dependent enzyme [Trueperaceae bacterium]|nr:MAG: aminotransferase class I/II-fold pyridoxal phosphate-dependent enzyme [Trueperaceae bacterium]